MTSAADELRDALLQGKAVVMPADGRPCDAFLDDPTALAGRPWFTMLENMAGQLRGNAVETSFPLTDITIADPDIARKDIVSLITEAEAACPGVSVVFRFEHELASDVLKTGFVSIPSPYGWGVSRISLDRLEPHTQQLDDEFGPVML